MTITAWLDSAVYPTYRDNWDNQAMRRKILAYISPESVVLDVGAGAGIIGALNFAGYVRYICGIDLDR